MNARKILKVAFWIALVLGCCAIAARLAMKHKPCPELNSCDAPVHP